MRTSLFLLLLALLFTGCFNYRELPVEYDYSYHGRFTKYRTFDFFDQPALDKDSSMNRRIVKETIASRMKILGYRQKDTKPNILVSYRLFFDSLKFNGYDQPDIEDWALKRTRGKEEVYDEKDINMKQGTLLIQFYDRRLQKSIWQGYATSTFGNIRFEDERNLRNAVISILDKYRFLAEGFLENEIIMTEREVNN